MAGLAKLLETHLATNHRTLENAGIVASTELTRFLVVILKTLYMFASIYVSTVLQEVLDRPSKGISLMRLLSGKDFPISLDLDSLLPAYCLIVYRNKLIAHHDILRTYGYGVDTGGTYRLKPLPAQIQIAERDVEDLKRMRFAYQPVIPGLAVEENCFNHLRLLFYGIPIGRMGEIHRDRKKIDEIAERGGCPSMTRGEIFQGVDAFSLAVVRAFK